MHLRCAQRWYEQPGKEPVCFLCKAHVLTPAERTEVGYVGGEEEVEEDEDTHEPALRSAIRAHNLTRVQELLAAGVDINGSHDDGHTVLMAAAEAGDAPIVEALLDAGALVDQVDEYGWTALMYACSHPILARIPIVELLIERGADPDAASGNGLTPLMLASRSRTDGSIQTVQLLVALNMPPPALPVVNVNQRDNEDFTILMAVSMRGLPEVAAALIAAGANVNLTNTSGDTALRIAIMYGNVPVEAVLRNAGAVEL
jgi:hypothetical protein